MYNYCSLAYCCSKQKLIWTNKCTEILCGICMSWNMFNQSPLYALNLWVVEKIYFHDGMILWFILAVTQRPRAFWFWKRCRCYREIPGPRSSADRNLRIERRNGGRRRPRRPAARYLGAGGPVRDRVRRHRNRRSHLAAADHRALADHLHGQWGFNLAHSTWTSPVHLFLKWWLLQGKRYAPRQWLRLTFPAMWVNAPVRSASLLPWRKLLPGWCRERR